MTDTVCESIAPNNTAGSVHKTLDTTWLRILIALVCGVCVGLLFGHDSPFSTHANHNLAYTAFISTGHAIIFMAEPIGLLFIKAIKMMVIPVVFVSIVCGVISFNDPKLMGQVGLRTLSVYVITMATALAVGLGVAVLIKPGQHLEFTAPTALTTASAVPAPPLSFKSILTSIVPENPIQAFAESNVLQTVVFAIIFGIAILCSGEPGHGIARFFNRLAKVIEQLPRLIMKFAPIGVFALITGVSAKFGLAVLKDLFMVVVAVYFGCLIQLILVYGIILRCYVGMPVHVFFKRTFSAMVFAFSTTSSAATLPYTHQAALRLGVSKRLADFIVPLGSTMNMNGLSVYLGVATVFAANIMHVQLDISQLAVVVCIGTLAAIGAAGVPGSALIVMSMVLGSIGFTPQSIALVIGLFAGVDRILDMATTVVNISGDTIAAVIVAKQHKELT